MTVLNPLPALRHLFSNHPRMVRRRRRIKKYKITWLGMISSGKTSLIQRITKNSFKNDRFHTLGIHVEELKTKHEHLAMWEIGGAESFIRTLWDIYTRDSDAIVFVIDSSAPGLFPTLKQLIKDHITIPTHLKHVPVLLLANKQDLPKAVPPHAIAEQLDLHDLLDDRPWAFFSTSAVTSQNLTIALNWLCRTIRITSEIRAGHFSDEKVDKSILFQYLSLFTTESLLYWDRDSLLRVATNKPEWEHVDLMEQIMLWSFLLPHVFLRMLKFLHHDVLTLVQQTLTRRIDRLHPSFSLQVLDADSLAMTDSSNFPEWEDLVLIEDVLTTIEQLKQDWATQELIVTELLANSHVNRVADRIVKQMRPLLEIIRNYNLGIREISVNDLEFKMKTVVLSQVINQYLQNISQLQELVTDYWNSFLESLRQKILEFNDKNTLAKLLEFNLPSNWKLDKTTRLQQWIVYRDEGEGLPAPPFYLKVLLENPKEPRIQVVLSCQECQQLLPTSFIPCIMLPPNKKIKLIDQHPVPVSENYLLAFGKIFLLVTYAETIALKSKHPRSITDRKMIDEASIEVSIRTQFLEKFGLTCNHYIWV